MRKFGKVYYERVKREMEACETYSDSSLSSRKQAALFTDGHHEQRYSTLKVGLANGIVKRKNTSDKAYKQAMS